jgi:hypothetical protein
MTIDEEAIMKPKTIRHAIAIALALACALAAASCKPEDNSRSAVECMDGFQARLNDGKFTLGEFVHTDATYSKNGWAFERAFWDNYLAGDGSFDYAMTGGLAATATEAGVTYAFTLAEDEPGVYAIRTITRTSDGYVFFE